MPHELSQLGNEPRVRAGARIAAQQEFIASKGGDRGADVSPPLEWAGVPEGTRSLALIVDDPDAPRGTWTHWVVANLDAATTSLAEGGPLPKRAQEGRNDFKKSGYGGACPPPGSSHRYFFRLYALDRELDVAADATRAEVLEAMRDHVLAQGELMGTYQR